MEGNCILQQVWSAYTIHLKMNIVKLFVRNKVYWITPSWSGSQSPFPKFPRVLLLGGHLTLYINQTCYPLQKPTWDFPGGPVVKILPSNARVAGVIPDGGAKISHASGQKNQNIK